MYVKSGKKHLRAFLVILVGFTLAFAFLFSLTIYVPLVGDILVGGTEVTRDFPTVSSAALHVRELQMATAALGSFWFWCGVTILGIAFVAQLWRWVMA